MARKSSRSKVELFRKSFISLARECGGSYATTADRMRIAKYFLNYLRENGIKLRQTSSIKTRHISGYLLSRKAAGISHRTIQNERAVMRAILEKDGRLKIADPSNPLLSNEALGLKDTYRDGKKIALSPDEFWKAFAKVEKKNPGVAAAMQLSYVLGLRTKEAVQSCKSVQSWLRELNSGCDSLSVVFGTKGGRPRNTTIIDRDAVRHALLYAQKIMDEHDGKLIDRPNIKQAINVFRYHARKAGLSGVKSPHSMRYHFSQEARKFYRKNGYGESEIYARVSMDLGHGDGRGRYVKQVYFNGSDES
ncbi:TPA: integrase domain-containing protein [Escherichia coli]